MREQDLVTAPVFLAAERGQLAAEAEVALRVLAGLRENFYTATVVRESEDELKDCKLFVAIVKQDSRQSIAEIHQLAADYGLHCCLYVGHLPDNSDSNSRPRGHETPFSTLEELENALRADVRRWIVTEIVSPVLVDVAEGLIPRIWGMKVLLALRDQSGIPADLLGGLPAKSVVASGAGAIAAGGDITDSVIQVTQYFSSDYSSRGDAYLDPRTVYSRVDLARFTGREWLTRIVDDFIQANDSGYFVLEADAGLGKSTFLAWLAHERGYIHHFSELAPGIEGVARSLGSLSAQLMAKYDLQDGAGDEMISRAAERPDGFLRLLFAASQKTSEAKIVIVVDALDEAGTPSGQNVLGLPSILPPRVIFIVSQRPVPIRLQTEITRTPRHVFSSLTANRPENIDDMRRFLEDASRWLGVQRALGDRGYAAADFVNSLLRKCGGVWIYLHYVVHEIDTGERSPLDLRALPEGMMQYYAKYWGRWREEHGDEWYLSHLPILATLAAAQEALPEAELIRMAAVKIAVLALRRLLREQWRPFITPVYGVTERYRFYHATLREFFSGNIDRSDLQLAEVSFIDELTQATQVAHNKICRSLLRTWGRLEAGLPQLKAAGNEYGCTHIAAHLEAAGMHAELHKLLRLENSHGKGLWAEVRENGDGATGYLNDVERAVRLSKASPNRDLSLQIWYALIRTTFSDLASRIPPGLLLGSVQAHAMPYLSALAYARQVPDEAQRARALIALHQADDAKDSMELRREIQDFAHLGRSYQWAPSGTIGLGWQYVRAGMINEARQLAGGITNTELLSSELAWIAAECYALGEYSAAIESARSIPDHVLRIASLRDIGWHLTLAGHAEQAIALVFSANAFEPLLVEMLSDWLHHFPVDALEETIRRGQRLRYPNTCSELYSAAAVSNARLCSEKVGERLVDITEMAYRNSNNPLLAPAKFHALLSAGETDRGNAFGCSRAFPLDGLTFARYLTITRYTADNATLVALEQRLPDRGVYPESALKCLLELARRIRFPLQQKPGETFDFGDPSQWLRAHPGLHPSFAPEVVRAWVTWAYQLDDEGVTQSVRLLLSLVNPWLRRSLFSKIGEIPDSIVTAEGNRGPLQMLELLQERDRSRHPRLYDPPYAIDVGEMRAAQIILSSVPEALKDMRSKQLRKLPPRAAHQINCCPPNAVRVYSDARLVMEIMGGFATGPDAAPFKITELWQELDYPVFLGGVAGSSADIALALRARSAIQDEQEAHIAVQRLRDLAAVPGYKPAILPDESAAQLATISRERYKQLVESEWGVPRITESIEKIAADLIAGLSPDELKATSDYTIVADVLDCIAWKAAERKPQERDMLLRLGLSLIDSTKLNPGQLVNSYVYLAMSMEEPQRSEILEKAILYARPDPMSLPKLAQLVQPWRRASLLSDGLNAAKPGGDVRLMLSLIAQTTPSIPAAERFLFVVEAVNLLDMIHDNSARLHAVSLLAPFFPEEIIANIASWDQDMADDESLKLVSFIAPYLPTYAVSDTLNRVMSYYEQGNSEGDLRITALQRLADRIATFSLTEASGTIVDSISSLHATSRGQLLRDLRTLGPALLAAGGPSTVEEVITAIERAERWWP